MIVKDEAVTSRSTCPCFIRCNSNFKIQDKNGDRIGEQERVYTDIENAGAIAKESRWRVNSLPKTVD